jgi:hypothetical protein
MLPLRGLAPPPPIFNLKFSLSHISPFGTDFGLLSLLQMLILIYGRYAERGPCWQWQAASMDMDMDMDLIYCSLDAAWNAAMSACRTVRPGKRSNGKNCESIPRTFR